MGSDPGFIFYPGNYLRDTQCLSESVQVAYDRIMCEHLRSKYITKKQFSFFTKRLSADQKEELLMVLTTIEDGYQIVWVAESIEKRKAFTESRRKSRLKSDEDKVRIYIVRDNVRSTYKIGSSVNPIRRYNELNNQKNPAIMDNQENRDLTLLWYSDIVVRSEEKKLHKRFITKQIVGEWFKLSNEDLNFIYKTYNGTYVERTENEIKNENTNTVIVKENKKESADFSDYENWTESIIQKNDQFFETMLMNARLPPNVPVEALCRAYLALLAQYPNKTPPDQHRFRIALLNHISENAKNNQKFGVKTTPEKRVITLKDLES